MLYKPNNEKETVAEGKEILINVGPVEKRIAILKNGEIVDFILERQSREHYAGSIYKGRVVSILPGIEAAFVDIGMEKNGFLHVSDVVDKDSILKELFGDEPEPAAKPERKAPPQKIQNILKKGQEIMVQVVKEAIGTKGPRLTTFISIPGRYLVLTPYDKSIGISRRITDRAERKRIRDILEKINFLNEVGCIVRTVSEKRSDKELADELTFLRNLWKKIKTVSERQAAPVEVYQEYDVVLRVIRDKFTDDITKLVVDSKEEYIRIIRFLRYFMPSIRKKVRFYRGHIPLFSKYDLDRKVDEIFERKVSLKSGGYLVIEQTEGVVVIDVNTGSFVGKKSLEETAFRTNMEAAEEIPRQLMLRDMGGIIIIDFIDMEDRNHREKIFHFLQEKLKDDKAKISLRAISQFGVVEMTRQRMRKSLERTSHVECPYCGGKGMIKSVETIAIEAVRRVDTMLAHRKSRPRHILIVSHPDVNNRFLSDQARILGDVQRKYRCKIDLREDRSLHIEAVIIEEK
ncbi:MAG: Rne/Rng family ribonuclease [Candidatus Omnitrophica bacterium]|nr:Rne/Rng family ribonuclease [Candidatus Omnitrophota bacterium]